MTFPESRNSGNPNHSAQCDGPGNGTSRHSVLPLCVVTGVTAAVSEEPPTETRVKRSKKKNHKRRIFIGVQDCSCAHKNESPKGDS